MNRSSGIVGKGKNFVSEGTNTTKPNRKSFQIFSESSSISSNRNSPAQSEEDVVNVGGTYSKQQINDIEPGDEREILMKKLQGQVKELRHKLKILEESVESKDYSLGTIAREKDRAIGEIRRLERSNKQLRQQLNDERSHYLEEKEKFCEEITRYKKRLQEAKTVEGKKPSQKESRWTPILPISQQSLRWHFSKEKGDFAFNNNRSSTLLKSSKSQKLIGTKEPINQLGSFSCSDSQLQKTWSLESLHLYEGNDQSLQMAALRTENAKLRSIICERDERNYELCLRFLRMKHCKNDIRTRFQDLENEYLQVITNLMEKIDEARQEFNFIIDQKFKKPLHSTNAMYLRLVQRNSRMAFENASLRLENQCLKKELKKHLSGVVDYERKIDQASVPDDEESKATFADSKTNGKLKRTKKNVNFKEIRTIYQRNLAFKNSDTDSNYMSKTSTTVPSNGSLTDPKSNESIVGGIKGGVKTEQKKLEASFQADSLPDEILKKIFKRVDTSSCQTLDSSKPNPEKSNGKEGGSEDDYDGGGKKSYPAFEFSSRETHDKGIKSMEDSRKTETADSLIVAEKIITEIKTADNGQRKMPNLTDSSTPCDSKESFRFDTSTALNCLPYSPSEFVKLSNRMGGMNSLEREAYLKVTGQDGQTSRYGASIYLNKDVEDSVRWLDCSSQFPNDRFDKSETATVFHQIRKKSVKDCCGLQERLDMSYQELPRKVDSKTQTDADLTKQIEKPYDDVNCTVTKQDRGEEKEKVEASKTTCTLVINTSKNIPMSDEQIYNQEIQLHAAKTYRIDKTGSIFLKESQCEGTESYHSAQGNLIAVDAPRTRRSEGSKRFSHRLISTSPEQLRSLLTESQLEACYRMAPIIVGHATTEVTERFQSVEPTNDIVLQLVIPASNLEKSGQIFAKNSETTEKKTLEKETSISDLNTVKGETLAELPAEICSSDLRIPVSNLPTSNSTMEVVDVDARVNDRTNIMLRTLSAPGLLESSWLDPYTICEMRDCSTNT